MPGSWKLSTRAGIVHVVMQVCVCVLHSQSVKYLQADRPYFLPPIVPRHGLRRPPKQVSSTMDGLFNFPLQVAKLTAVAGSSEILLAPFPLVL